MKPDYIGIGKRYVQFFDNWQKSPNIEAKLFSFLFSEVYNDLLDKGIETLEDWLKYYSTDDNDFSEIVKLVTSYHDKILMAQFDQVTFAEKVLGFNAFAIYVREMDIDIPKNTVFQGKIMATFIEFVMYYDLVLKGYLSVKGDMLISDRNKCKFYNERSAGNVKKELQITSF
jgi:hypothetical protein